VLQPSTRAAITEALIETESTANQYGWDHAPVLFGLFDLNLSSDRGRLEVDPTLAEPSLWDIADPANRGENLPVPAVLHRFAHDLSATATRGWLHHWLHRDGRTCIGIGLLFEAWAGPAGPGYRRGDLATSPARREVRVVAAVDIDLGLHRVIRTRGEQPPTVRSWPHLPAWSSRRGVVTGLRALTELARTR
jgi:hypothetical protein